MVIMSQPAGCKAARWFTQAVVPQLAVVFMVLAASDLHAAAPTVEQALNLEPLAKNVDFDRPAADVVARCTIRMEKFEGTNAWVVRDPDGRMLRAFPDTNADRIVDRWVFFRNGIEVYRDIDSDFNTVADQSRRTQAAADARSEGAGSVRSQSRRPFVRR